MALGAQKLTDLDCWQATKKGIVTFKNQIQA